MLPGYRGSLSGGREPGACHALVVFSVKKAGGLDLTGENTTGVSIPSPRPQLLGASPVERHPTNISSPPANLADAGDAGLRVVKLPDDGVSGVGGVKPTCNWAMKGGRSRLSNPGASLNPRGKRGESLRVAV